MVTGIDCAMTLPLEDSKADKIATENVAVRPMSAKTAIVLAAVQGEALSRRPGGRPGPPLRATAEQMSVGTKEWRGF
jgi:hypothetical protein